MAEGHHFFIADGGKIKTKLQSEADISHVIGVPTDVTLSDYRPRFAKYRRAVVTVGRHTPGSIYRDDFDKAFRLGLAKPVAAPTNAVNGVGITGAVITYYNYQHLEGATLIHEGNLSPASATISLVNQGIDITVPGTAPQARTTHIGIYASVDGDIPKFVARVTLGTTVYNWVGPVSGRGATIPVNADGTINVDGRGEPPADATIICTHGERVFYNSRANPERAYYSLLEEPESVGPLAFFPTKDREAIVAFGSQDDQLIIPCAEVAYDLQGFSAGGSTPDFKMRKISHSIGCISHDSMKLVFGKLHWASKIGPVRNPGGGSEPEPLIEGLLAKFWVDDYASRPVAYEDSQADFSREHHGYRLLIPGAPSFSYVGSYAGQNPAQSDPEWYFWTRARFDNCLGTLWDPNSGRSYEYVGNLDGFVRKENQYVNDDDDDDVDQKTLSIQPKHFFFPDQFGDRFHGATTLGLTLYMRCVQEFVVSLFTGDDTASEGLPQWGPFTFPSMNLAGAAPETSRTIKPRVGGQGVSCLLQVPRARNFEWRGFTLVGGGGVRARALSR